MCQQGSQARRRRRATRPRESRLPPDAAFLQAGTSAAVSTAGHGEHRVVLGDLLQRLKRAAHLKAGTSEVGGHKVAHAEQRDRAAIVRQGEKRVERAIAIDVERRRFSSLVLMACHTRTRLTCWAVLSVRLRAV